MTHPPLYLHRVGGAEIAIMVDAVSSYEPAVHSKKTQDDAGVPGCEITTTNGRTFIVTETFDEVHRAVRRRHSEVG